MGNAIVTLKIMGESPEVNMDSINEQATKLVKEFGAKGETKSEIKPVAFGLKAVELMFMMDESLGSTEPVEKQISEIEGVQSVEVADMRRAFG